MNTRIKSLVISLVCALWSFQSIALQSPQPKSENEENIERITVYGQKSIRELNREIQKITKSFFKDYNKLNKNNQYNVICKKQSRANTSIKVNHCEPRYVKMHRAQRIDTLVFGNDPSALSGMDLTDGGTTPAVAMLRLIGLAGVNKVPPAKNKKFFEHLSNLMNENPLLLEKYQKIIDLKEEYVYKKTNR